MLETPSQLPARLDLDFGIRLSAIAAAHRGVVLTCEVLASGYSDLDIARRVRSGAWVRVRRGAFVTGARWAASDATERHLLRATAVLRRLEGDNHLTHVTGLAAHGATLLEADLGTVHIVRAGAQVSSRAEAGCVHSRGVLPQDQRTSVRGLPTCTATRCSVDFAR